jgi:hypothetical protein
MSASQMHGTASTGEGKLNTGRLVNLQLCGLSDGNSAADQKTLITSYFNVI